MGDLVDTTTSISGENNRGSNLTPDEREVFRPLIPPYPLPNSVEISLQSAKISKETDDDQEASDRLEHLLKYGMPKRRRF